MSLIERYILAVTERLPEATRKDVGEELRSNIEDMLPENATEEDIRMVLEKLGNPKKLAQEYNPSKRYLIGPEMYDSYFAVLKVVAGIVVTVILAVTLLDWVVRGPQAVEEVQTWARLFGDMLSAVISGGFQAAFWVTLVFVIMERSGINDNQLPFAKKEWSIEDLPTGPISEKSKISRTESVFSLFFTILIVVLLYLKPKLIAVYITANGKTDSIPLFNIDRLKLYILAILIIALFQLCVTAWKFIQGRWTIPLAIANSVQNLASCIFVIVFLNDRKVFNSEFFAKVSGWVKISEVQFTEYWFWGTLIFTVVIFTGISIWESISAFYKCRR